MTGLPERQLNVLLEQLKLLHDHIKFRIQLSLMALVGVVFGLLSLGPVIEKHSNPSKFQSPFLKIFILLMAIILVGILWYCFLALATIDHKELAKIKKETLIYKTQHKPEYENEEDMLNFLIENNLTMIKHIQRLLKLVTILIATIFFISTGPLVITLIKLFR